VLERVPRTRTVTLLTGGFDKHYTFGLATALALDLKVEIVGSDELDCPQYHKTPNIRFLNLHGNKNLHASPIQKASRLLVCYARLIRYAATARPRVFHILWNNKFETFDRTVLMLYYKLLGKRIVLTAHNVNQKERDGHDSMLNRLTLRIQYHLADRVFVHTEKMKNEICSRSGLNEAAVELIPYGINNAVPTTNLTPSEARAILGIQGEERAILFFGNLRPSKGLQYLVTAFQSLVSKDRRYRLIIAGERKRGSEDYVDAIRREIRRNRLESCVIEQIKYIPDEEVEVFFKAADVFVLPYIDIFQSGILFLGSSFGLPVVATDVGSLRENVMEGETGFICTPRDPLALAGALEKYFASDLYANLNSRRRDIEKRARRAHSWKHIAETTAKVYLALQENCS
jgi:D-inositol-3-phosphate glycosyltransferase